MNKTLGIVLIVLGLIGIVWGGITYTTSKKVLDLGPIEARKETNHTIPVPPIAGVVALAGGIVLLLADRKHA